MELTKKIKHLVKVSTDSQGDESESFLPKEVFRRIIDRERDRANRTGEVFSLVVYLLSGNDTQPNTLELLSDKLISRVRSIDAIGWLDSQHIGILLPETDSSGARKFANKIHQEIQVAQNPPGFEIFTYPSDHLTNPEKYSQHVTSELKQPNNKRVFMQRRLQVFKPHKSVDYMFCLTKKILKRSFDVIGSSVFLMLFSPLFLLVAVVIKLASPGPIFYKQQRIGYAGKPFTFLKFRTMCSGADNREHQEYLASLIKGTSDDDDADAPMAKLDHDPQIIPFGNMLRKSCLDELPQLINVLRGEMSLVGPRPPIPYEVKEYLPWHRGRFDALPGMTGLWQVSGKNKLSFREMVRLDICYARERSIWMDIKILFKTPIAIWEQLKDGLTRKNTTLEEGV